MSGEGSSRNISIVNGQVSASISQNFALTPTQPGEYIIPALKAEVGGQVLTTQPLKLTAVKADSTAADGAGEKLAFFKLFVPRKEVYVGEVLAVEFQVYVREGLANGENILQSFDQYGGCPVKAEGVSILKTAHAQRRRVRVGNATYGVATLVTSLSPVKTGPLTLGSMDVTLTLQIPLPNQRRRDPFDPFGIFQQMQVRGAPRGPVGRTRDDHRAPAAQRERPRQFQRRRRQFLHDSQRRTDQCHRGRPGHR